MTKTGPLSPHLQIYRLPLSAYLSILHRITGVVLTMSLPVLALWLAAAAWFPEALDGIAAFWRGLPGQLLLFLWSAALAHHFVHGLRHLLWDLLGLGFERERLLRYALLEMLAVLVLLALIWTVGR